MTKSAQTKLGFVLLAIIVACPGFAVTMDVKVGFDGVAKGSLWTPIAVQFTNTSGEDVQGEITISDEGANPEQMPVCTTEVNLPAKSQKLYHSYVRLMGYGGEFSVSLVKGSRVIASKRVNANLASAEDKLIVSVGNRSSRLGFLQGETIKIAPASNMSFSSSPGRTDASLYAGSLEQKTLPDRPAAYEGVDLMVLSEMTPSSSTPNALKAIGMWVASGGTLVIPTGANSMRFADPFYKDLLPVTVIGATNVNAQAYMSGLGNAPFPAGACAVANSVVKPGVARVVASAGAVPLIVERTYGAGKVIYMAFDIKSSPFKDWNGQTEFWKSILKMPTTLPIVDSIRTEPERNSYNYQPSGLTEAVAQNPSVKMPSFNTIGVFLIAYLIILVPVNFFVLKKRRRLELAWVTTPVIVVAFTLGAYAIGYTMKGGDLQLREAVVIEGSSGARFARMVSNASVFSPARRTYDIAINDPSAISQIVANEGGGTTPVSYLGDMSRIPDLSMAMWSSKLVEAVGGVDLGGALQSQLMVSGNKLTGQIKNETDVAFRRCLVVHNNSKQDLGRLNPGDSANVDMTFGSNGSAAYASTELDQKLDNYLSPKIAVAAGPVLIAVPSKDTSVINIADSNPSASRAVRYVFHLDYAVGGAFKISEQSVIGQILEVDYDNGYSSASPSNRAGELAVEFMKPKSKAICMFRLPVPSGVKITSIHIRETSNDPVFSYSFYNYTTGKWEPFKMGKGITISNAAKFVGARNEVQLKAVNTASDVHGMTIRLSAEGTSL